MGQDPRLLWMGYRSILGDESDVLAEDRSISSRTMGERDTEVLRFFRRSVS